jgi:hypothetical protein
VLGFEGMLDFEEVRFEGALGRFAAEGFEEPREGFEWEGFEEEGFEGVLGFEQMLGFERVLGFEEAREHFEEEDFEEEVFEEECF